MDIIALKNEIKELKRENEELNKLETEVTFALWGESVMNVKIHKVVGSINELKEKNEVLEYQLDMNKQVDDKIMGQLESEIKELKYENGELTDEVHCSLKHQQDNDKMKLEMGQKNSEGIKKTIKITKLTKENELLRKLMKELGHESALLAIS